MKLLFTFLTQVCEVKIGRVSTNLNSFVLKSRPLLVFIREGRGRDASEWRPFGGVRVSFCWPLRARRWVLTRCLRWYKLANAFLSIVDDVLIVGARFGSKSFAWGDPNNDPFSVPTRVNSLLTGGPGQKFPLPLGPPPLYFAHLLGHQSVTFCANLKMTGQKFFELYRFCCATFWLIFFFTESARGEWVNCTTLSSDRIYSSTRWTFDLG